MPLLDLNRSLLDWFMYTGGGKEGGWMLGWGPRNNEGIGLGGKFQIKGCLGITEL